ncbi:P-loop NTPase [Sorangium sp. So ce388]|uniref:nucleotide-binding protein n=1 Tax=Sorangium sp. So ce388 TaxID=3133309 RepID=UPI003F5C0140
MMRHLRCYSFHSVKGGVGKSTLSALTAVALAETHPEARVYLVDMDLTGTSLADVLPLEAPSWAGLGPRDPIHLLQQPDDFHKRGDSVDRIEERGDAPADSADAVGVPFLNDYLLFRTPDWDEERDVPPAAICWRLEHGPKNLRIIPSSALPRDLSRALPVIYDEEHAAFLEGRLEYLLTALLIETHETFVVFDTPPTIPGLSRSVLNLAFRLSHEPKTPLSEDGFMPQALQETQLDWRAFLIATQDYQDIRAAARWLDLVGEEDLDVVRLVLNRVGGDEQQQRELLLEALRERSDEDESRGMVDPTPIASLNPLVARPIWVQEDADLQAIFRAEKSPPVLRHLLEKLEEESP